MNELRRLGYTSLINDYANKVINYLEKKVNKLLNDESCIEKVGSKEKVKVEMVSYFLWQMSIDNQYEFLKVFLQGKLFLSLLSEGLLNEQVVIEAFGNACDVRSLETLKVLLKNGIAIGVLTANTINAICEWAINENLDDIKAICNVILVEKQQQENDVMEVE